MLYGRSDKRGYMLLDVTPKQTVTHFMGLDDVGDAKSAVAELASFRVDEGVAQALRIS